MRPVLTSALRSIAGALSRLTSVDRDREALKNLPKPQSFSLPPVPIVIEEVKIEEPPAVSFHIGDQNFLYEEDIDWAEKGTTVVRGDLQLRSGDPATLPMDGVPENIQVELVDHLTGVRHSF